MNPNILFFFLESYLLLLTRTYLLKTIKEYKQMKNLLSENMLRFGTKNLSELAQRELVLKSVMQTINEHGLHEDVTQQLNEALLMEGVPNTTMTGPASVTVPARTLCLSGNDYIQVSFIVQNTGTADAYLTQFPFLVLDGGPNKMGYGLYSANNYNVTIGGKPSWGQADQQNSPKVPAGKKATVNMTLYTNGLTGAGDGPVARRKDIVTLKSGKIKVRFNGGPLEIPVTFGGFTLSNATACDVEIVLPKGF